MRCWVISEEKKLRIVINTSKGEPERLIEILKVLANCTAVHSMIKPPARVRLCAINATGPVLLERVQEAAAGGVAVNILVGASSTPFIYGRARDAAGVQHGTAHPHGGKGYGEPGAADTGGKYVSLYV